MEYMDLIMAVAIAVVFSLVKFVEYKFILKEDIDVKQTARDSFLVGASAVIGQFIIRQVDVASVTKTATNAFVGIPDF